MIESFYAIPRLLPLLQYPVLKGLACSKILFLFFFGINEKKRRVIINPFLDKCNNEHKMKKSICTLCNNMFGFKTLQKYVSLIKQVLASMTANHADSAYLG